MSLRSRLLAATLLLAGLGLLVANVATYRALNAFLLDRVDRQLVGLVEPAGRALDGFPGWEPMRAFPAGTYIAVLDASGRVVRDGSYALGPRPPPPRLPEGVDRERQPFTARADTGDGRYRVLAREIPGATVVVALPLDDVIATQRRLLRIELIVGAAVLAGLAAAALWLVRLGLRPLERMGETAGAIAGGDLSRRVEPSDDRTEVGRLGLALNAMLAQIEEAFAERRASEARLRQFVADASHELRTPLTSIRGYAELFRRGAGDRPADLAKAMRRIEDEGARMGDLVDELLLLARLDQGRPLEREAVDLTEVTTAAVDAARASDPDRPIDLEAEAGVTTEGDSLRLRQILDNLLSNALRHTPSGTPVRVRVERRDGAAILEVSDEGPGIAEPDRGRVFERFYRADPSRSRDGGGVGLGLSIVAAVTEAHGGRVVLEPSPSGGATFRIELPVAAPAGS